MSEKEVLKSNKEKTIRIKKKTIIIVSFFVFFLIIILCFVFYNNSLKEKETNNNDLNENNEIIQNEINDNQEIEEKEEDIIIEESLSLIMVGDCLIHGAIYDDARENGSFNFDKMFENVKPIIQEYDLAFYNQESILGGTSLGLSSYPRFNSPQEVGDTFINMGFNLVGLANNHTLDMGKKGIKSSLAYWKTKEGIITAGSYENEIDRITPKIMEKNGIKYALLSYTTTTNGLIPPSDEPYLITVYDKEKVKEDVERLRENVDLLLVSMHWGEEYTHTPNAQQVEIAEYLASLNVDIVIGHHPHVVQPMTYIDDTLVIYSLGNFIASQYGIEKLTGLMASVTVKKITTNGVSETTLENPTAELVYTYSIKNTYRHSYKLYPYKMLNNNLLNNYETHFDKYIQIVTNNDPRISIVDIK